MDAFKWFFSKNVIEEHDGYSCEVCTDIKLHGEVRDAFKHHKYFLLFHGLILSSRYPFPEGGYIT